MNYICRDLILIQKVMINKIVGISLLVAIFLFATIWIFNHINAWVAIGIFIVGIYIAAINIFKNDKKTEK
jgi:hypothetical protein